MSDTKKNKDNGLVITGSEGQIMGYWSASFLSSPEAKEFIKGVRALAQESIQPMKEKPNLSSARVVTTLKKGTKHCPNCGGPLHWLVIDSTSNSAPYNALCPNDHDLYFVKGASK
jgi:hypothetical protein